MSARAEAEEDECAGRGGQQTTATKESSCAEAAAMGDRERRRFLCSGRRWKKRGHPVVYIGWGLYSQTVAGTGTKDPLVLARD